MLSEIFEIIGAVVNSSLPTGRRQTLLTLTVLAGIWQITMSGAFIATWLDGSESLWQVFTRDPWWKYGLSASSVVFFVLVMLFMMVRWREQSALRSAYGRIGVRPRAEELER